MYFRASRVLSPTLLAPLLLSACPSLAQRERPAEIFPAARKPTVLLGGVPEENGVTDRLELTLEAAVRRGLERNLAALLARERVRARRGERRDALSELLPRLGLDVRQSSRQVNLDVIGFSSFPGLPDVVGPFSVFDARLSLSVPLIDEDARHGRRGGAAALRAAELTHRDARERVAMAVVEHYLAAVATESLVAARAAQVRTAETLRDMAQNRKQAGLVAAIDVLRAQVQLQEERQALIAARNDLDKRRLVLARMIGLPLGQEIALVDRLREATPPLPAFEDVLAAAWERRRDLEAAHERVEAARQHWKAEQEARLPSLQIEGDYGILGGELSNAKETFDIAASLRLPIFDAGIRGGVLQAEGELRARQAELEDLRASIWYEVRSLLLDAAASAEQVDVARSALELSHRQLEQARNRFAAGVSSSLEVVESQEAVATANEAWVDSLWRHARDRARLARAQASIVASLAELVARSP